MSAIKFNLNLKDFHRAHKSRKHGIASTANFKQFKQIIDVMGDIIGDELVKNGNASLPGTRWKFKVIKKKNPYYVDRGASKKAGERILATNDHSDGFACTIMLDKDILQFSHNSRGLLYCFKADRDLNRIKLKNYIQKNKAVIYNYETLQ